MKIKEVNKILSRIMPTNIAFDWDNVGLLIGDGEANVEKVLLTLDVTSNAIEKAIKEKCNLIISHHPIIFGKINKINNPLFLKLIRAGIDVISMHTNLDSIPTGVNRVLAEKLGLESLSFIAPDGGNKVYWGKVFVPETHAKNLEIAITKAGAGLYEKYSNCVTNNHSFGAFTPNNRAKPMIGKEGIREVVTEIEFQFRVDTANYQQVIEAIKKTHPYETPVYHFYEINDENINYGSGMLGSLASEVSLEEFALLVKNRLNAPFVKLWSANKADTKVKIVAVCGGSGSFLINRASTMSDVIVTGDVTYHTMLDSKLPIIDAGHFYTENPVLEYLSQILSEHKIDSTILTAKEHEINKLKLI